MPRTPTFEGTLNKVLTLEEQIAKLEDRLIQKHAEIKAARSVLEDLKASQPEALAQWAEKKSVIIEQIRNDEYGFIEAFREKTITPEKKAAAIERIVPHDPDSFGTHTGPGTGE